MPCSVRTMREILLGKLECEQVEGRKHTKYRVYSADQVIAWTVLKHGVSELSDGLMGMMANELCITTNVLKKICSCVYGLTEYRQNFDPNRNPHYIHNA